VKKDIAKIRGKSVYLRQPYRAPTSEIVGREQEMTRILAAWMSGSSSLPLSPLLLGEPGVGKNRIVYECARLCKKELYIYQGHEDTTVEDLVCAVRFSDDPDKKMDYIVSPLVTAMLRGGICFIDEIGKIRQRALAPLVSVLDERRYLDSDLLGERFHAHSGFRFVAATNSDDLDENPLPKFIKSRLRPVIAVEGSTREEIERIVSDRFERTAGNGTDLLHCFWELWERRGGNRAPTPRDSLYIFGYAINLADFDAVQGRAPYHLNKRVRSAVTKKHIERAFDAFQDSVKKKDDVHTTRHVSLAK